MVRKARIRVQQAAIAVALKHRALATQFLKFGIVGTVGFGVDALVLLFCMKTLGLGPYTGRLLSYLAAATVTWGLNRSFTFKEHKSRHKAHVQWARFVIVNLGGFVLNYGTYAALVAFVQLVADYPVLGIAAGSLVGMFFNFGASKRLVFG